MKPNALRVLRAKRDGVSQYETAKAIGVSLTRLFRLEKCRTEPTKDEVTALAMFFDVKPSEFYSTPKASKAA